MLKSTIKVAWAVSAPVLLVALATVPAFSADSVTARIHQLKEQGKREGWTFEVGANPSLELPEKARHGAVVPEGWETLAGWVAPKVRRDLPSHFDWRDKGVVGPVKDQAYPQYCGACWAFGTVAVMESVIKIKTGRAVNIAEQQLVSCRPSYGSCSGGYFAFGFYKVNGANYETDFPYQAADVACDTDAAQHEKVTSWNYIGEKNRQPTTDEIKQAIYQYGPVAATVSASGAWDSYKSGVYNACNSNQINHIIAIVGWDDTDQAWIVRNSHGEQFGENGYIRMKYVGRNGRKCNNIGQSAAFAVYNGQ